MAEFVHGRPIADICLETRLGVDEEPDRFTAIANDVPERHR